MISEYNSNNISVMLTDDYVQHIARLSKIDISHDDIVHLASHLKKILNHAKELDTINLEDIPEWHEIQDRPCIYRKDEISHESLLVEPEEYGNQKQVSQGITNLAIRNLKECLSKIEDMEDEINAFNEITFTGVSDAAENLEGSNDEDGGQNASIHGMTIAYKDNICTSGVATTCSSKILEGWKPPYNATVVERLEAAGMIMVGKTNMDEFAMGSSTEHSAFGTTKNPHDTSRVPGGSSGGSAAAVAAGFTQAALGSDTGGSVRQPAALCGVVGMKPTYGRVSRYGLIAFASSFDQIGPITQTVKDAALVFEAIAGYDPMDCTTIPEAAPDCLSSLGKGVEGLKVGVVEEFIDASDSDVVKRVEIAANALSGVGAKVDKVSIPSVKHGLTAYYIISSVEASSNMARFDGRLYMQAEAGGNIFSESAYKTESKARREEFGEEVVARIMLGTFTRSAGYYDAYYSQAQKLRVLIQREFESAYSEFDVLMSPTSPCVAFKFGQRKDPIKMYKSDLCTIPSSLIGDPAISVPFGIGDNNMPVGVQVLAPALHEPAMFQVAAELERIQGDV